MKLADLPKSVQKSIEALLLENNFPAAKALYDREIKSMAPTPHTENDKTNPKVIKMCQ